MVTRWGRYHRELTPGLHFYIPFVERLTREVSLKEKTRSFPHQKAITKDGLQIFLECTLYDRIINPYQYCFGVDEPDKALEAMAMSLIRCEIGKLTLDEVLQKRQHLNQKLSEEMRGYADRWGIICSRYEITKIDVDPTFDSVMSFEAESERERRKIRLEAQQFEETRMNEAQRKRVTMINERTVEGKQAFFDLTVWASRIKLLRVFADSAPGNWEILEAKLKAELVKCYGQLAKEDQQVFMRHDVAQVGRVLGSLFPPESPRKHSQGTSPVASQAAHSADSRNGHPANDGY